MATSLEVSHLETSIDICKERLIKIFKLGDYAGSTGIGVMGIIGEVIFGFIGHFGGAWYRGHFGYLCILTVLVVCAFKACF